MVNEPATVNIEGPLDPRVLRVLQNASDIVTAVPVRDPGVVRADAVIRFVGTETPVAIECKSRVNAATAQQLISQPEREAGIPLLLVAQETSADARATLREHGIGVIDGLGNVHVELPGLLLHVEGRGTPAHKPRPVRLTGKAGVVAQALLLDPSRIWRVGELAERAHVSPALAHRVLARLDREGITTPEGGGPQLVRRIASPAALLDLWAEEERDATSAERLSFFLLGQSERMRIATLAREFAQTGFRYAFTGAAGASMIAPFVTAVPVIEAWIPASVTVAQLAEVTHATPVPEGPNVVLLQGRDDSPLLFNEEIDDVWVANRFRVYLDLLRDPRRGAEQARHLREEAIGF